MSNQVGFLTETIAADLLEVVEAEQEVVVETVRRRVEHDDVLERGQRVSTEQHLGELVLIADKTDSGTGVADDVGDLGGCTGRIGRDGRGSRRQDRDVGLVPSGLVRGEQCDTVARLDPQRNEAGGDLFHRAAVITPRDCRPLSLDAVTHRGAHGRPIDSIPEDVDEVGHRRSCGH